MAVKKAAKKATKKVIKPNAPLYKASLIVMGRTYVGSGTSTIDALSNMEMPMLKGRGILTMSLEDKSYTRILMPFIVSRLSSTRGIARDITLKNISILFGI